MERILCLTLGKESNFILPLFVGSPEEVDKFTSSRFENFEDIYYYFKKEIDMFLDINSINITNYKESKNENFPWIFSVLDKKDNTHVRKSVLYKKHAHSGTIKQILNSEILLRNIEDKIEIDKTDLNFLKIMLKSGKTKKDINRLYNLITNKNKFQNLRVIHNIYNSLYKKYNFKSITEIYNDLTNNIDMKEGLKFFYENDPFLKMRREYNEEVDQPVFDGDENRYGQVYEKQVYKPHR